MKKGFQFATDADGETTKKKNYTWAKVLKLGNGNTNNNKVNGNRVLCVRE